MSTATLLIPEAPGLPMPDAEVSARSWARDDPPDYEIVDGRRVEMPPMSAYSGKLASRIMRRVGDFAEGRGLGETVVEILFRIPLDEDPGRNRKPDVAFVSYERWPAGVSMPLKDNAWDVVPDLVVEVVSPTDRFEDVIAKLAEYFRAGTKLAWVVLPVLRQAYLYDGPKSVRIIDDAGSLDGGAVLPGFLLPLASVLDPPSA